MRWGGVSKLAIKEPGEKLLNEPLIFSGVLVPVLSRGFGWLLQRRVIQSGCADGVNLLASTLWLWKDLEGRWFGFGKF